MFGGLSPTPDYKISTFRPGLALDLLDGPRRIPLFVLEATLSDTFKFDDSSIDLDQIQQSAPWISREVRDKIKAAALLDDLFEDL